MAISTSKIESLLSTNGFTVQSYMAVGDECVYIHVSEDESSMPFLVYIPSKYTLKVKGSKVTNMKYLELDEEPEIADEYAGEPNEDVMDKNYNDILLGVDRGKTLEDALKHNYDRPISLKGVDDDTNKDARDLVRQMKRLSYCTKNIPYKSAIIYKNLMTVVRRDDSVDCLTLSDFEQKKRKLVIVTDLEIVYEKLQSISRDIRKVASGLYRVLSKNHSIHIANFKQMILDRKNITAHAENCYRIVNECDKHIERFQQLDTLLVSGKELTEKKLQEINRNYATASGMHRDMERSRKISAVDRENREISLLRKEITRTIFELQNRRDDILLGIDQIMFDCSIMLDAVSKNFSRLEHILN